MHRTSRITRPLFAGVAAALLTAGLAGCTLVTTLAEGDQDPTPTATQSKSSTPEATTSSPKPTTTSPGPTTTSPGPTNGDRITTSRAEFEEFLAGMYQDEHGTSITVSCPEAEEFEVYDGYSTTCTGTESGGTTVRLHVEVSQVNAADNSFYVTMRVG